MPRSDQRADPFRAYNFTVEIEGQQPIRAAFSEVSGLTADGDSVDYREGTDIQQNVRKLVGLRKYSNVTLKRGYTQDPSLWQWYTNIMNGVEDRRHVAINLLNERRQKVLTWIVENAWINKLEGPSFKASSNEVAIESMELVHEGLRLEM